MACSSRNINIMLYFMTIECKMEMFYNCTGTRNRDTNRARKIACNGEFCSIMLLQASGVGVTVRGTPSNNYLPCNTQS